jgi:hypothetical protein
MSAPEQFHDLSFEQLDNGTIRLEQKDYCGESSIIDLHPCQIRHIAERAGLLSPAPVPTWPRGFLRRVERFHIHLAELVDFLASIPSFPPQVEMDEDEARARDLLNDLDDLLTDFGILSGEGASNPPPDPLDASPLPGCLPNITGAAGGPPEPSLFD